MKKKCNIAITALALTIMLTGCGLSEEGKHAQSLLNALPETYSVEIDAQLEEARAAYDALPDEEKEKVDKSALDALEQAYINTKIAEYAATSDMQTAIGQLEELYGMVDAFSGDTSLLEMEKLHDFHKSTVESWQKERDDVEDTFDGIVGMSDHLMTELHLIVTNPEQYNQTAYSDELEKIQKILPKLKKHWNQADINKLDEQIQLGAVAHLGFAVFFIQGDVAKAASYRTEMKSYTTLAQELFYNWWTTEFSEIANDVNTAGGKLNDLLDAYPDLVPDDVQKVDNSEIKN